MVSLQDLNSVFEIGFAIHVAVPLLQNARRESLQERMNRLETEVLTQVPDVNRNDRFFRSAVSTDERILNSFLRLIGFTGIVVAIYSVSVLIVAGILPDWARVSEWQALILVLISLLPVPLLVGLLELFSSHIVRYGMVGYAKWTSAVQKKFGKGPLG